MPQPESAPRQHGTACGPGHDVAVVAGHPPELFQALPTPAVVVGPLRGQQGDRVVVGAAGGIYPAFYLSRFQPAKVLKANKSAAEASGKPARNAHTNCW